MPVGHLACRSGPEHASATRRLARARRTERRLAASVAGHRPPAFAQERLSSARAEVASGEVWLHWIEQNATPEPWADGEWGTPPGRIRGAPAARWVMPAELASVGPLRARVLTFARGRHVGEALIAKLRLAASEAITNAVLHAFHEHLTPGTVTASVEIDEATGVLTLIVADDGTGMTPRPDSSGLGLGLALIGRVADELTVDPGAHAVGTVVRMTFAGATPDGGGAHAPRSPRGDDPDETASSFSDGVLSPSTQERRQMQTTPSDEPTRSPIPGVIPDPVHVHQGPPPDPANRGRRGPLAKLARAVRGDTYMVDAYPREPKER